MIRAAAFALFLTGCSGPAISPRTVTWTMTEDPTAECGGGVDVHGCAMWLPDVDQSRLYCRIVTRPPESSGDVHVLNTIHHELRHCQEGRWHD